MCLQFKISKQVSHYTTIVESVIVACVWGGVQAMTKKMTKVNELWSVKVQN